jgi:cytochrome c peroxidase
MIHSESNVEVDQGHMLALDLWLSTLGSGSCAACVPRSPWLYVALRPHFGDRKVLSLRRRPELSPSHIYARRANE